MKNDVMRACEMNKFIQNTRQELLQLPGITDEYIDSKFAEREKNFPISILNLTKIVSGKDDVIPFIIKKAAHIFHFGEPDITTWKFNSADYFDVSACRNLKQKILEIYNTYKNGNKFL